MDYGFYGVHTDLIKLEFIGGKCSPNREGNLQKVWMRYHYPLQKCG